MPPPSRQVRDKFAPGCQKAHGLSVTPKAGSALVFYNLVPNSAEPDFRSWHASCDVESGRKLAANLWFNLGLEDMQESGRKPFGRRPGRSIFGTRVVDDGTPTNFKRRS